MLFRRDRQVATLSNDHDLVADRGLVLVCDDGCTQARF
jgi:hypothetical protein